MVVYESRAGAPGLDLEWIWTGQGWDSRTTPSGERVSSSSNPVRLRPDPLPQGRGELRLYLYLNCAEPALGWVTGAGPAWSLS